MKYEKKNNKYIFQMTKRKELYAIQFRWFEWKEHICCERAFRKCWLGTIERRTHGVDGNDSTSSVYKFYMHSFSVFNHFEAFRVRKSFSESIFCVQCG